MSKENNFVLAMYDIRGIQDYIFRTAKLRDAIGASAQVENIILDALSQSVREENIPSERFSLIWENEASHEEIVLNKNEWEDKDVQILYIGGGNGLVIFSSREIAISISKKMSKIVMDRTYSLQLAVAIVKKTENYSHDYEELQNQMRKIKDTMILSKPVGAPAIVEREIKTGYPLTQMIYYSDKKEAVSTETYNKIGEEHRVRKAVEKADKILDQYITEKGVDSTIAVVHIDGNNMGMRIGDLIKGENDYTKAVNRMRKISYNISHDYIDVFNEMYEKFNNESSSIIKNKKDTKHFVMKVLVAGDDITYVCNSQIAFSSVEYFCKKINNEKYTMLGENADWKKYGFSVCAGIAFAGSHFPFGAAYEVSEECCDSAKDRAKEDANIDKIESSNIDRIGNWLDFQICKNIQTKNLKAVRLREYETPTGESLLRRPYFVPTAAKETGIFKNLAEDFYSFDNFKKGCKYFQNETNMPRSFSKELRNTYPLGEKRVDQFKYFLDSRKWKLPEDYDKQAALYKIFENNESVKNNVDEDNHSNPQKIARWYDALEMLDYFTDMNMEEA